MSNSITHFFLIRDLRRLLSRIFAFRMYRIDIKLLALMGQLLRLKKSIWYFDQISEFLKKWSPSHEMMLSGNARTAMVECLRSRGLGAGTRILVPSYTCPDGILAPLRACGFEIAFYDIESDFRVNQSLLLSICESSTIDAVILTQFGGVTECYQSQLIEMFHKKGVFVIIDSSQNIKALLEPGVADLYLFSFFKGKSGSGFGGGLGLVRRESTANSCVSEGLVGTLGIMNAFALLLKGMIRKSWFSMSVLQARRIAIKNKNSLFLPEKISYVQLVSMYLLIRDRSKIFALQSNFFQSMKERLEIFQDKVSVQVGATRLSFFLNSELQRDRFEAYCQSVGIDTEIPFPVLNQDPTTSNIARKIAEQVIFLPVSYSLKKTYVRTIVSALTHAVEGK